MDQRKILQYIVGFSVILSLFVVMLGAYTRLTHAGLGCPDWPGCYGQLLVPSSVNAQAAFPDAPLESVKAWTEMAHRYVAGTLVLMVLAINLFLLRKRKQFIGVVPWQIPLMVLGLIFFQAALGMWTVTLKLLPLVVMGHLLGGITIFTCLTYLLGYLSPLQRHDLPNFRPWIGIGCVLVFLQIALGGWVSANYAAISCIGFPQCNGIWLPQLNLFKAFNLLMPVGANYQGGVLDPAIRITIQFVHRLGAITILTYILTLMSVIVRKVPYDGLRRLGFLAIGLVILQFTLGIINVTFMLPLSIAVAHNGTAAVLLATLTVMFLLTKQEAAHANTK